MRSAIINGGSSTQDVLGVLTGVWNEYEERGWHIVKTPFFVSMTATLSAGPQILPVVPRRPCILRWANGFGNSGNIAIKAKQKDFTLPENAVVQIELFGTETQK